MIWIGTSGFQYPEWKGNFYPSDLSTKKMLAYYAERFSTTEVNYTFYRLPSPATLERWAEETPRNFRFSLKAPKQITHVKRLADCAEILRRFWTTAMLLEAKLGPILFQLPPFLRKDVPLLKQFLGSLPGGMKSAFEFRHVSWFDEEVFDALRACNAALCVADSEKLSTPLVQTADFGYFRLRHEGYKPADIKRWAEAIKKQARKQSDISVYFKHEKSGVGPTFARQLNKHLSRNSC